VRGRGVYLSFNFLTAVFPIFLTISPGEYTFMAIKTMVNTATPVMAVKCQFLKLKCTSSMMMKVGKSSPRMATFCHSGLKTEFQIQQARIKKIPANTYINRTGIFFRSCIFK
jgi:hypothetical protein